MKNRTKKKILLTITTFTAAILIVYAGSWALPKESDHRTNEARGKDYIYDISLIQSYGVDKLTEINTPVDNQIRVRNVGSDPDIYGAVYLRVKLKEYMELAEMADVLLTYSPTGNAADAKPHRVVKAFDGFVTAPAIDNTATGGTDDTLAPPKAFTDKYGAVSATYPAPKGQRVYVKAKSLTDAVPQWYILAQDGDDNSNYGSFLVVDNKISSNTTPLVNNGITRAIVDVDDDGLDNKDKDAFDVNQDADTTVVSDNGNIIGFKEHNTDECAYDIHEWRREPGKPNGTVCTRHEADGENYHDYISWQLGADVVLLSQYDKTTDTNGQWVLDDSATTGKSGWAYWSKALYPDEETSNLLQSITLTTKPDDAFYYNIHTDLESVSLYDLDGWINPTDPENKVPDELIDGWGDYNLLGLNILGNHRISLGSSSTYTPEFIGTAILGGEKPKTSDVTWRLEGTYHTGTTINATTGELTVALGETAPTITIVATYDNGTDPAITSTKDISLGTWRLEGVTAVMPTTTPNLVGVNAGTAMDIALDSTVAGTSVNGGLPPANYQDTSRATGETAPDSYTVSFAVSGNTSANTRVDGTTLKIDGNERGDASGNIYVTATATFRGQTVTGTTTVTIVNFIPTGFTLNPLGINVTGVNSGANSNTAAFTVANVTGTAINGGKATDLPAGTVTALALTGQTNSTTSGNIVSVGGLETGINNTGRIAVGGRATIKGLPNIPTTANTTLQVTNFIPTGFTLNNPAGINVTGVNHGASSNTAAFTVRNVTGTAINGGTAAGLPAGTVTGLRLAGQTSSNTSGNIVHVGGLERGASDTGRITVGGTANIKGVPNIPTTANVTLQVTNFIPTGATITPMGNTDASPINSGTLSSGSASVVSIQGVPINGGVAAGLPAASITGNLAVSGHTSSLTRGNGAALLIGFDEIGTGGSAGVTGKLNVSATVAVKGITVPSNTVTTGVHNFYVAYINHQWEDLAQAKNNVYYLAKYSYLEVSPVYAAIGSPSNTKRLSTYWSVNMTHDSWCEAMTDSRYMIGLGVNDYSSLRWEYKDKGRSFTIKATIGDKSVTTSQTIFPDDWYRLPNTGGALPTERPDRV